MTTEEIIRFFWERIRPLSECCNVLVDMNFDFDFEDLEKLEVKFQYITLPVVQKINFSPLLQKELDRRITFGENKRLEVIAEYEKNGRPFSARRELIEVKLPVVEKYLRKYREWKAKDPKFNWDPLDVVDLKWMGIEKFIRFNFERFYE